jgi:mRNA-degrading endonuclease RelE of RelBE toxin-antitoxin system
MKVIVSVTKSFKKQAKPLLKKYASLSGELEQLRKNLSDNPYLGTEIMHGVYKIRLAIKSKGKGKSAGARIISFHQEETTLVGIMETQSDDEYIIHLIAIYDKSDVENISDTEIRNLINNMDTFL